MVNIQRVSFPRSSPITLSQPLVCHPDAQGKLIDCALDAHREKILRFEEIKVTHTHLSPGGPRGDKQMSLNFCQTSLRFDLDWDGIHVQYARFCFEPKYSPLSI